MDAGTTAGAFWVDVPDGVALERYRTLVNTVDDGIYQLDAEGRFVAVNDIIVELTGYPREELIGSFVSVVLSEEDILRIAREIYRRLTTGETEREIFEFTAHTADGEAIPCELRLNLLVEDDTFQGTIGIVRDITERKRAEQIIQQREEQLQRERLLEESNERLNQFAYAVSHDLQEPLRMISSYLQLVRDRYADELDEDGQEFIEFAVDGAHRMKAVIEGLLDYSRVETEGEPFEPVELGSVLNDARENLRMKIEERDATITAEQLPTIVGNETQLRQVFQNLLSNAIEYSGDDPPRVHIGATREDTEWVISVSDEGIGIDPTDAGRVFEVFQRLHSRDEHDGAGIGLALCDRIIERHGGRIWVDSTPGEGSTFSFTLPAQQEQ